MGEIQALVSTKVSKAEETKLEQQIKELEPIVMLVRYPKVALLGLVFFYLMAFQEIRHLVLPFL
jgi:hypothetical protein